MVKFRLFGIPVTIEPWFWLTLALLGGAFYARTTAEIFDVALFVLAGGISVLVHELGHALTGRAFGASSEIVLRAFGGYASFPGRRFTRVQDFVVTLAGPAVQIVLGLAALALIMFVNLPTEASKSFVGAMATVSLFWAILNLLPVIPLDGGRLVLAVLGPKRERLALWISLVTALLVAVGMLLVSGGKDIIFPIFLAQFAFENWKMLQAYRQF